jgi:hypothetical protein
MYGVSKALRRAVEVYTQQGAADTREAQEAEIALGMVQTMLALMPDADDLVVLFKDMHQSAFASEGDTPRVRKLSDTYLRLKAILEGCRHSVVSTDLMAVRQATAVLTMAAEAMAPGVVCEVAGGDEINAELKGAVLTSHFASGMSLELTLAKGLDHSSPDAWVIDGGIWMRNTVLPAINPTVYEVLEGRVGHVTVVKVVRLLKQLIPYCQEQRTTVPSRNQLLRIAGSGG